MSASIENDEIQKDKKKTVNKKKLEKKLLSLSIIREKLGISIKAVGKLVEVENLVGIDKLKKDYSKIIELNEDITQALIDLYQERNPVTSNNVITLEEDELVSKCQKSIPILSKKEGVVKLLESYQAACATAFQVAVQKNDKDALSTLRKASKTSIQRLSRSIDRWVTTEALTEETYKNEYTAAQNLIQELEILSGESSRLTLMPNWQNQPFTYQFYLGFDINKVDSIDTNAAARVGALVYFRPGRQLDKIRNAYPDCSNIEELCGQIGLNIPHFSLSLKSATGAEQSTSESSDVTDWEAVIFAPVYIGRRGSDSKKMTEFMVGPVWTRGARDIDSTVGSLDRKYWGFRLAFNEETYFDLLRGNSDGLDSKRFGLRGQFPVSELGSGRLFFGYDINFSSYGKDSDNVNDSTSLYLVWQTSFDDLWKVGSSK